MTGAEAPSWRLFVALPLPEQLAGALHRGLRESLFETLSSTRLRWIPPQNYHLTLAFLGQKAPARQLDIDSAMRRAARVVGAFELRLDRLDWFPSARRPRVLALLPAPSPELVALQACLVEQLQAREFALSEQAYRPHLSLARTRARQSPPVSAAALGAFTLPVRELVLYRSVSGSGPVQYWPLSRAGLSGEDRA